MKTLIELVDSGSTLIETGNTSKLKISVVIDSTTEIMLYKSEQLISVATQSLIVNAEKSPITLIQTSASTNVSIESIGTTTVVQSLLVGLKGDKGDRGAQGIPGDRGPSGNLEIEEFTLSPSDIQNKYVLLSFIPSIPSKIELSIFGGIEQRPLYDFGVDGNKIFWNQLALELLLEEGMNFVVRYIPI